MVVKRYDPFDANYSEGSVPAMEETSVGGYVAYEDYEELYDKLCVTETKLKWLEDKITDIWRDI